MTALTLRGVVFIRVDLVLAAVQQHSQIDVGEARDGRGSCRSGRPAADLSPTVHGPAACSRAPPAAAIWQRLMVSRTMSPFGAFSAANGHVRVWYSVSAQAAD